MIYTLNVMPTASISRTPKLRGPSSPQAAWYPYYAGFSEEFAKEALSSASIKCGEWVVDPWNGSGTTISTALSLGLSARGYDLNPVMVLVAKARCLEPSEYSCLRPLAAEITKQSKKTLELKPYDPLLTWFCPNSVASVRAIEAALQRLLIDDRICTSIKNRGADDVSDIAAFFYVVIFRTIRQILRPFLTSNPTWIKQPRFQSARLRPAPSTVRDIFHSLATRMIPPADGHSRASIRGEKTISVASSESLPLPDSSVHCVLGSPPYCTRIDYAVATSPELAMLGYGLEDEFDTLRRGLIGTSTVPTDVPEIQPNLGRRCLRFLKRLSQHPSKASSTYYYKNHAQYFVSMATSLSEIRRILKTGGQCILVVQDSYYKDIHNDLPDILTEMAALRALRLSDRIDFPSGRTLAGVNPGAREYRTTFSAVESVLTFEAAT